MAFLIEGQADFDKWDHIARKAQGPWLHKTRKQASSEAPFKAHLMHLGGTCEAPLRHLEGTFKAQMTAPSRLL